MDKKVILLLFGLFGIAFVNAQSATGIFAAQNLIKAANAKAFAVVEQKYQLKDKKGNVYGLNGNEEFGKTYSLAVVTDEGMIVTDKAARPWDYDSNYDQYKNDKNYEPILYETDIKSFGEKELVRMECTEESPKNFGNGLFMMPCFHSEGGLSLMDSIGADIDVDGWMIWAMHPTATEVEKNIDYNLFVESRTFIIEDGGYVGCDGCDFFPPQNGQRAIGGFFVVPHILKAGTVSFDLCAVAYKENDEWWLKSTIQPKKKAEEKQPKVGNDEEKPKPSGGKLTPVGKKGKKGNKK